MTARPCPECNKLEMYGTDTGYDYRYVHPKRVGAELTLKSGKFGDFYGCENFPSCECTQYSERGARELAAKRRTDQRARTIAMVNSY